MNRGSFGADVPGQDAIRSFGTTLSFALAGFGVFAILRMAIPGELERGASLGLAAVSIIAGILAGMKVSGSTHRIRIDTIANAGARDTAELAGASQPSDALQPSEKTLRANEASFQALLDTAVDAIITIDELGAIESVNRSTERLFGWCADELIGKNVKMLMPSPFHQEHDGYLANYRETAERKIIGIGREVVAQRKDGTTFPIDLAVNEVSEGGHRRFMGVIRDITDRRRAEEALRRERDFAENLLDTAPVIVLALDTRGRILRANRFLEVTYGRECSGLVGQDWADAVVPAEAREEARARFCQGGDGVESVDKQPLAAIPFVTADGNERQIEWVETTLHDAGGGGAGTLLIGVDVSDRVRLEEQFRQAQKMDAVGRLAGGIAHDFNTLLGSITGYSEMLLDRLGDDRSTRHPAEQIYRCADRGAALTRQLLAFSRQHVIEPRVLDLGALLREMEDMLDRLCGDDVDVQLEIDADTGSVWADASQVEQVIMNLVVNALDAMPRGGRVRLITDSIVVDRVCPDCGAALESGRYARIMVRDTGFGMSKEILERLFEPFFTTKEQGRGTGLGLATVYGIVKKSGGCVGVDSEPGVGTIFRICLPSAANEHDSVPATIGTTPPPTVSTDGARGNESVLLVEDDPTFLELIQEVLEARGYHVRSFSSPEAALASVDAAGERYDLLVSDIVMPGMNGTELAREVARRFPKLQVLLMSGYTDEDLESRGAISEHVAYIQKPFSTVELVRLVRTVLDNSAPDFLGIKRSSSTPPPAAGEG